MSKTKKCCGGKRENQPAAETRLYQQTTVSDTYVIALVIKHITFTP